MWKVLIVLAALAPFPVCAADPDSACEELEEAVLAIRSPHVPFPVSAGTLIRERAALDACITPGSALGAREIFQAAARIFAVAAPYGG